MYTDSSLLRIVLPLVYDLLASVSSWILHASQSQAGHCGAASLGPGPSCLATARLRARVSWRQHLLSGDVDGFVGLFPHQLLDTGHNYQRRSGSPPSKSAHCVNSLIVSRIKDYIPIIKHAITHSRIAIHYHHQLHQRHHMDPCVTVA